MKTYEITPPVAETELSRTGENIMPEIDQDFEKTHEPGVLSAEEEYKLKSALADNAREKIEQISQPPIRNSGESQSNESDLRTEIVRESAAELEAEFAQALQLLEEGIIEGRWSNIIADDARGRLPAIAIRKALSLAYAENGHPSPDMHFLAGARHLHTEAGKSLFDPYITELKKHIGEGRVLIVADYMFEGQNIGLMLEMLHDHGIEADVLSFSTEKKAKPYEHINSSARKDIKSNTNIYSVNKPSFFKRSNSQVSSLMTMMKKMNQLPFQVDKKRFNKGTTGVEHHQEQIPVAAISDKEANSKLFSLFTKIGEESFKRFKNLDSRGLQN